MYKHCTENQRISRNRILQNTRNRTLKGYVYNIEFNLDLLRTTRNRILPLVVP